MGSRVRLTLRVPNGQKDLLGPDMGALLPCGCSLVVLDRELRFETCADPEHEAFNRDMARRQALRWGLELTEVPLPNRRAN